MAAPNIDVVFYPQGPSTTQRQILYLELAPKDIASQPTCVLPLQIWIHNKESNQIHLESIEADFSDPSLNKTLPVSLDIAAGAINRFYSTNSQYIVLPSPPPTPFTVKLQFTGFSVWSDSVNFVPTPDSYHFPGKAADLAKNVFWKGSGMSHAGGGDQLYHYDLAMQGWNPGKNQWTSNMPGTSGSQNSDYYIWGKPVYAIADGTVMWYSNSVDANPNPPNIAAWGFAKGYGNAFNIQHGAYVGTYMHMQKGSLNPALITGYPEETFFTNGKPVKAGDFLGLAGNAGTSSEPHLHVGLVIKDPQGAQFSIPLPWVGVWGVDDSELPSTDPAGAPWASVSKQGLPWVTDGPGAVSLTQFFRPPSVFNAAIDPLALILGGTSVAYINLTLPDPPPPDVIITEVQTLVRTMSPGGRARAEVRIRELQEYLQAVQAELNRARG